jgi:hypothetical protein
LSVVIIHYAKTGINEWVDLLTRQKSHYGIRIILKQSVTQVIYCHHDNGYNAVLGGVRYVSSKQ